MQKPWLELIDWEFVTATNAALCQPKKALHKPTTDGCLRKTHRIPPTMPDESGSKLHALQALARLTNPRAIQVTNSISFRVPLKL